MVIANIHGWTDVEGVVDRDLVSILHQLVQRAVMEGGREVAKEACQTLARVYDVPISPQDDDEPVHGLQHEVGELLRGEELGLPVSLYVIRLNT